MADEFFLSRWSRLKSRARQEEGAPAAAGVPPAPAAAETEAARPVPAAEAPAAREPLPPVESLTPDSDFTPFMRSDVDPNLKRQALSTLFRDPRFNVMDGLDVYIDDFSKPDPLPPEWLGQLRQMARLGEYRDPDADAREDGAAVEGATEPVETAAEGRGEPAAEGSGAPSADTSMTSDRTPEVDDSAHLSGAEPRLSGVNSANNKK